jgi:hypothetical protein
MQGSSSKGGELATMPDIGHRLASCTATSSVPEPSGDAEAIKEHNPMRRAMSKKDEKMKEMTEILKDLIRCGDFFDNAIELDMYEKPSFSGQEFENRIKSALGIKAIN